MLKPSDLGYRMPAEWEKHEATWLAWPHNKRDWPGKFMPVPWIFAEIIRAITKGERCRLVVKSAKAKAEAKSYLERAHVDLSRVDFYTIPTNRGWMRDAGPIFITNGHGKAVTDWKFNGWAKYGNHRLDDKIPSVVNGLFKLPHFKPGIVLEGGAIDVNGKGVLMTTEECLLSETQARNRGMTRHQYEAVFAQYLGISHTIWLDRGIIGDDTHGHIDDIARFVAVDKIVACVETNRKDDNHAILKENLRRLKKTKFKIIELPMPSPVVFDGQRLPASYANFLITNSAVLVPIFGDANDRVALDILAEIFPKRDIVPIYARDLVWGLGTIHCLTQQEPS